MYVLKPCIPIHKVTRFGSCTRSRNEIDRRGVWLHKDADVAYLKARLATEVPVAEGGGVYLTVRDEDKDNLVPIAAQLRDLGFTLYATPGTADVLRENNVPVEIVYRIMERMHPMHWI